MDEVASLDLAPGETAALGERGLLIGTEHPAALRHQLSAQLPDELEVTAGIASVLISSDDPLSGLLDLERLTTAAATSVPVEGRSHVIEVLLDGEDLAEVVARTGLDPAEIALELASAPLEVATVGFSPGFGYLRGLRGGLAELPRRPSPRARVPAGSLAVAAGFAALYPQESPGGWWLLGRSAAALFDPRRKPPSLLEPGDSVQLVVVTELEVTGDPMERAPLRPPVGCLPAARVLAAPPGSSVVDDGRRGLARVGVPRGGPLDPDSALLLDLLLGGAASAIELAGAGLELELEHSLVVACIGLELQVDGRPVPDGVPLSLPAGSRLLAGLQPTRACGYLSWRGGVEIEPLLGSMGTDALSLTGPGWLSGGDLLGQGAIRGRPRTRLGALPPRPSGRLRYLAGPHQLALEGRADQLEGLELELVAPSNRVGHRVAPTSGPLRSRALRLSSLPVLRGAIQLPPDGKPIILGPDHATLGGYPVLGCLIAADLGRLGRMLPGSRFCLEAVSAEEAGRLDRAQAEALQLAASAAPVLEDLR